MSQRREKKRRRIARQDYLYQLERWRSCEPPWWRFISHWWCSAQRIKIAMLAGGKHTTARWKKDKPVLKK